MENIITTDICDGFQVIDYLNEKIIIRKEDNYININKLLASNNITFKEWCSKNKSSKDLIYEIDELININNISASIKKSYNSIDGSIDIKGIYVHCILAMHILSSTNFKLFLKLDNFFNIRYKDTLEQYIKFNYVITNKPISTNDEESFIKLLYKTLNNHNLKTQAQIEKYKVDCLYETDEEVIIFEYDEKEHIRYDKYLQLKRYKAIFNTLQNNKIHILRFSDSVNYDEEMIYDIIKYTNKLNTDKNIIYINYNKDNEIMITEFIDDIYQYSFYS